MVVQLFKSFPICALWYIKYFFSIPTNCTSLFLLHISITSVLDLLNTQPTKIQEQCKYRTQGPDLKSVR